MLFPSTMTAAIKLHLCMWACQSNIYYSEPDLTIHWLLDVSVAAGDSLPQYTYKRCKHQLERLECHQGPGRVQEASQRQLCCISSLEKLEMHKGEQRRRRSFSGHKESSISKEETFFHLKRPVLPGSLEGRLCWKLPTLNRDTAQFAGTLDLHGRHVWDSIPGG